MGTKQSRWAITSTWKMTNSSYNFSYTLLICLFVCFIFFVFFHSFGCPHRIISNKNWCTRNKYSEMRWNTQVDCTAMLAFYFAFLKKVWPFAKIKRKKKKNKNNNRTVKQWLHIFRLSFLRPFFISFFYLVRAPFLIQSNYRSIIFIWRDRGCH